MLPSFVGERAPVADAAARGGVVGLDLREDAVSLEELYVAGLCGLACGIADIVDAYGRAGYAFDTIVASGGAARERARAPDRRRRLRPARRLARDAGAGAARLCDARRGRLGPRDLTSAMASMSAIGERVGPAGGAIAAFHARKRRAAALLPAPSARPGA